MAPRCLLLIVLTLAFGSLSSIAQVITATRPFVDLEPVGSECQVETCVEISPSRTGICAVEVIDASGSMDTNDRFSAARAGVEQFIDSLRTGPGDYAGVVTFSGPNLKFGANPQPSPGPPSVQVVRTPSQSFESVKATLPGLSTASVSALTPLAAAIAAAAEVLTGCPDGSLPVMILSTDGYPNWASEQQCTVTPIAPTSCTDAAVQTADAAKAGGIHIVSIGIDLDPNDQADAFGMSLLQAIATSPNDANFFNTHDGLGQSDIFRHLSRSIASPRDVILYEPLPDSCWEYVAGSSNGSITQAPTLGAIGGVQNLTWDLGVTPGGQSADVCYSIAYKPSCGSSPSSLTVGAGGEASWALVNEKRLSDAFGIAQFASIRECAILIPVELTDITATSSGTDVHLVWHTASERDNAGFAVERSSVVGSFAEVGFVTGRGTSQTPTTYSFVDRNVPHGVARYRLRQIDFDGAFEYSQVVETRVELPSAYYMSEVYPNPMHGVASLDLSAARSQVVRVDLVDMSGRIVRSLSSRPIAAGTAETIDLHFDNVAAGAYAIRVLGEFFTATRLAIVSP